MPPDHTTQARDQWLRDQLEPRGEHIQSIEPVRAGPQSVVLAVHTASERYYFKACEPVVAHEPALVAALAQWAPDSVPPVLAIDTARRWLLMADGGPTVRELVRADGDRRRSVAMLEHLAALQQATSDRVQDLLALGVPDRRLDRLPALLDAIMADTPALMIGHDEGMTADEAARLRAFTPTLRALCDELAATGIPATLHHDDFHSGNVGLAGERYHIYDWGEAFVAHPFYALLIALRDAKYILGYDQPALDHMRDAYLACWTGYDSPERLRAALTITHRLAALGRALTWWQILAAADATTRAADGDAVPYWLLTFLHDTPLAGD